MTSPFGVILLIILSSLACSMFTAWKYERFMRSRGEKQMANLENCYSQVFAQNNDLRSELSRMQGLDTGRKCSEITQRIEKEIDSGRAVSFKIGQST